MSYIIGFATSKFVYIVSDGREINSATGEIVSENYNKTDNISNRVILGYAGDVSLCNSALTDLRKSFTIYNINSLTTNDVVSSLRASLRMHSLNCDRNCSFIVAGLNNQGLIELDAFSSSITNGVKRYTPIKDGYSFAIISPANIDGDKIFEKHLSLTKFEKAFEDSIAEVATLDCSVNTRIFSQGLSLND